MQSGERHRIERLATLAAVLSDPFVPVHDPLGYARTQIEAATLIAGDPSVLRRHAMREAVSKERLAALRAVPELAAQAVPESQRAAVRLMRELTTAASDAATADPQVIARMVAVHRQHRGGAHYDTNLGHTRAALAESYMEAPSRRRRRKHNPTPQVGALGVGEAVERVKRGTDRLIADDAKKSLTIAARAREIQMLAELIGRYPKLIEREYLRQRLGRQRIERLSILFG